MLFLQILRLGLPQLRFVFIHQSISLPSQPFLPVQADIYMRTSYPLSVFHVSLKVKLINFVDAEIIFRLRTSPMLRSASEVVL